MEQLRPCLFFYLLAILLSLSISSTTNSDPTKAETLQWKGGEGAKRTRVRRQNLNLQHALRLPEKAYAFYMLWRLVNEMYNDTNAIKALTMRPVKLEFTTSEGPKNMEIEVKPSSAPILEQSTHSIGMTGTNDSTAMASFPSEPSSLDSQKTTQLEDVKLVEQSTQRLQTTIEKITEPNQAIEQHIPDSTTSKIPSPAAEEPSTIVIHEQIDHFTSNNGTNNCTTMASFPTHSSLPDSQQTTPSVDPQLVKQTVQRFQTTKQKITEPSEVTEQHILYSTTLTIKTSSTAAEEPSSINRHEQIDPFTAINRTNNSTAMVSLPTQSSLPDSQEITQSEDSQLAEKSNQRLQTTKQKVTEPNKVTEQHIPDSTTFTIKISSTAAEEPSTITIHEQIDHFTGINRTNNNSTAMASFPTHSLPDSLETTQSDSQLAEKSTQRLQTTKQKVTEPNEVTEQHIPDSTTFTIKTSSKAAEEPSSTALHEQISQFTGINGTNNSTATVSLPTQSSLPDSQQTTQSGDPQLVKQTVQRFQTTKQTIREPSEVTEQHILYSTTFTIKTSSTAAEEPSSITIHEQIDPFTGINRTNNSTVMASFPTHSLPDSLETTHSEDSQLAEKSTQRLQTTKQKVTEPNEVTEQHIPDSTTFTIKISSKAAEEPSSTALHEQISQFTGINGTNNSTAMVSLPTQSSLPDSQQTTQSGDSQLVKQTVQRFQTTKQKITEPSEVTEQHILYSTTLTIKTSSTAAEEPSSINRHEQIDPFTAINRTNNSTAMVSLPTQSSLPDSQEITQSEDSQLAEKSNQRLQTTKQKVTEPNKVTEQHIPDSTTFTIKISSTAAEEPSTITIHEQIDHFTGINRTNNNSTAMASFPTHSLPDSLETTQSDSQLAEKSTQRLQTTKQKMTEPNEVTEQLIPDSTTFTIKISSKAAEEPSSTALHEQISQFTGINGTNNSTATVSLPTQSSLPDSQQTTQSGDPQIVKQTVQRFQTTKQTIREPSEVTEQHILYSTTFTIKTSSTAAEEPSSITIHEQIDPFTGINRTNNSTVMASFPTHSLPDSLETTQSDSQLAEKSTQRLQTTKQKVTEPNEVTEQHIPDSTTFTIKTSSKAAEEPSSTALHEQIDHFTSNNGTHNFTTMASFPTHSSLSNSQETTPSVDSQLVEQSVQHVQTTKQKIIEPSEVTEQLIPDSTTLTIKTSSTAVEEPSTITIHEQIDHFTGINGTNNSTTIALFPDSLPDSQETTQSGDLQLAEQSAQYFQTTKHKITEPSEVTEQHTLDSTTFTIKISSKAAQPSIALYEQIDHVTGINGTDNSTTIALFLDSLPDSQETTQSGDSQLAEQSAQHFQTTKHNITEPSEVTEQHTLDSTTFTNKISKAAEEPSSITIHKQIYHFTDINGTNNSTAVASFPIQSSLLDSQKPTQTGDSEIVEESPQHENPEPIIRSTGTNGTNDSTPIMYFPTDLPPQGSQKNTQSGAPKLLEHSTQHFQILKKKMTAPSQKIVQPTALMPTPDQATTYRIQQTTPLQSAIDPHIPNNDILASTMENENLQPTSHPQTKKNEQPKMTPVINGMVQRISNPTPPASTKQTTIATVKSEIKKNSVTWQNGKPNWLVTSTDWRVSIPTFTLKQQIQDSTSLLLTEDRPNSDLSESTSDPEHHKPKPTEEPINQHTEKAPTDGARSSQTIPVSTETLITMFTPNPKPSEKHIQTTSVMRHGFLTSRTQENPSWISTKRSNIQPTETEESRSDSINQEHTVDSMPKENYTNNDLTEKDKPMQSTSVRQPITTQIATTRTVSQKHKTFILPTHKSANTAIEDDTKTRRNIFGLLFTFGCLMLLLIVILLRVIWRKWQARRCGSNMWVAGPPLLRGTYHSVLQNSSSHTAIQMRKENSKKTKQENSDVHETIALKQQNKDLV